MHKTGDYVEITSELLNKSELISFVNLYIFYLTPGIPLSTFMIIHLCLPILLEKLLTVTQM